MGSILSMDLLFSGALRLYPSHLQKCNGDSQSESRFFSGYPEPQGLYELHRPLGGVIENAGHGPEGTKLIVIQTPLDAQGYPQTSTSEGEFIAHTPRSLDLQVFQSGTKVTIAGEVDGVDEKELGPMEYPRPLVRVIEIHAWTERLLGIFPLTKGWRIDQSGPFPSPFEEPPEKRNYVP